MMSLRRNGLICRKENQTKISNHIVSAIIADALGFHRLHEHDAVALNGGDTFFGMAAGTVRIGTDSTLHAACGERQHIAEFLSKFIPESQCQLLVIFSCIYSSLLK